MAYNIKPKKSKPKPKSKSKPKSTSAKMKQHSKTHSKKHINIMKKEMKNGKTFAAAHKIASKIN
jgi:hypothetical protein